MLIWFQTYFKHFGQEISLKGLREFGIFGCCWFCCCCWFYFFNYYFYHNSWFWMNQDKTSALNVWRLFSCWNEEWRIFLFFVSNEEKSDKEVRSRGFLGHRTCGSLQLVVPGCVNPMFPRTSSLHLHPWQHLSSHETAHRSCAERALESESITETLRRSCVPRYRDRLLEILLALLIWLYDIPDEVRWLLSLRACDLIFAPERFLWTVFMLDMVPPSLRLRQARAGHWNEGLIQDINYFVHNNDVLFFSELINL